jgi:hypothetical protein
MSQTLWIGTRKGLFAATRRDGGWTLGSPRFLGDPVTMVLDDPRDGTVYAALNLGHFSVKLHRSSDRGTTWQECGTPSYAFTAPDADAPDSAGASTDPDKNDPDKNKDKASLELLWSLEAGGAHEPGRLWAGTIPGGLFGSPDRGETWEPVRSLWDRPERREWFGGGYDKPGIHSIAVDPRDAAHLTVAVSCGGVWTTHDGGASWDVRSRGMFAAYMPPEQRENPAIQDPHRLVSCASTPDTMWVQHHSGIFRSRDAGKQWHEVSAARPSVFGFAVAVHPRDPETAWFVPAVKDERRVPVDAKLVVSRTRDGGKSFEVLDNGLPSPSYDLVYRHALDVDTGGMVLAFGSTTGGLWISEDGGDRWQMISAHLPPIYCVRFGAETPSSA